MLKLKRSLLVILSLVLVIGLLASVGAQAKRERKTFVLPDTSSAEINTSRYTQYSEAAEIAGDRLNTEGFEKVIENDAMELWFREEIASIRVVDKYSGYVWGELEADTADGLNDYWITMANSMLTIEYYDEKNAANRVSMSDESFENTYEFDDDADVMFCDAYCPDLGIAISFEIALMDDHLEAYVLDEGIYEDTEFGYLLSKLYLLPFFGCTPQGEMDGYIFVPDGSGALMRFDEHTTHNSLYIADLYGKDAGVDLLNVVNDLQAKRTDDYLVEPYNATVPVYGIVHGAEQYAAMTIINSGKDFAAIQASLASDITPYNWVTTIFEYRQLYQQPVSKTSSITRPQPERNNFTPKISIYLLSDEDASYNGMALKYRSILEDNGTLGAIAEAYEEQIPLRLEVLGSDVKSGFIFNSVQTFTSTNEALDMQTQLSDMGINNLTMVMTGWQKGGVNGNKYGKFTTQSTVGSMSDLEALRDSISAAGGKFYLQNKAVALNESQGKMSYLATQTISKKLTYYLRDNPSVMFPETYLALPRNVASNIQNATTALAGFNLNLPRLGSELYSHYEQEEEDSFTRSATRKLFVKTAQEALKNDVQLSMSNPNVYMWENCSDYFDIPMMNSQYMFESDSVPFLQILLKGHINYYAPYANQGFYTTACTLKSIEYGAYPSFLVMAADNGELNKTPQVDFFSLNFGDWKGTIETVYKKTNAALSNVEGAMISEHKVIAKGVVRVTYDNDVKIYVNYNSDKVTVDDVVVEGLGFAVERG